MAEYLSDKEYELVERFRTDISEIYPDSQLSYDTALKFLFARKFDVHRAKELFIAHEKTRIKERLINIDPSKGKVKAELLSGKFTILPARDTEGAALALFTVRLHDPSLSSRLDLLKSLLFQLDAALDSTETQRYGLIFMYDMTDCKFHHFDFEISKKILNLLKDSYPARLRKVLIVNPPIWFRYPFKCLQILLKKKLQERVHMLTANQLNLHLPIFSVPIQLAGHLQHDHFKWLEECLQRYNIQSCSIDNEAFFDNHKTLCDNFRKFSLTSIDSSNSAHHFMPQPTWAGIEILAIGRNKRSVHLRSDLVKGLRAEEFVTLVERVSQASLMKDYGQLKNGPSKGAYNTSKMKENAKKNRYVDVTCLDETRVPLLNISEDFIHANFVDGYYLTSAYICTQGPLPHTAIDFWKMVWDYHVLVIVMLTRTRESGRIKCHQYWPLDSDIIENYGDMAIINNSVDAKNEDSCYTATSFLIQNTRSMEMREVIHMQFIGWPDYGAPNSSEDFLNFLLLVKRKQEELFDQLKARFPTIPTTPPIVIHCSAGIGRSGTFMAIDICIDRLVKGDGFVDVFGTVERIRSQRPGSIQTADQFVFCHSAISDFIITRGLANQFLAPSVLSGDLPQ